MNIDGNTPLLSDIEMRQLGFTDRVPEHWYTSLWVGRGITLNITIDKATGNYEEYVLDEDFGQPYPYMRVGNDFGRAVRECVDRELIRLNERVLTISVDHDAY